MTLAAAAGFCAAVLLQRSGVLPAATPAGNARPGPVDIGFAQFMSVHHDQAVTMCQILLAGGRSRLTVLANAILSAQLIEIGEFRGWLYAWKQPRLPTSRQMDWLLLGKRAPDAALLHYIADCRAAPGGMAGLATTDELNRLRALDGDARDRLFLELMIRHHAGALPMAQFAARNADTPVVRAAAQVDWVEQGMELGQMKLVLEHRFGTGAPP